MKSEPQTATGLFAAIIIRPVVGALLLGFPSCSRVSAHETNRGIEECNRSHDAAIRVYDFGGNANQDARAHTRAQEW